MTTPIVIETTTYEPADRDDFLPVAAPQPAPQVLDALGLARRVALAE